MGLRKDIWCVAFDEWGRAKDCGVWIAEMDVGGVVEEVDHLREALNEPLSVLVSFFTFSRFDDIEGCGSGLLSKTRTA